jgi:hypothetical protein
MATEIFQSPKMALAGIFGFSKMILHAAPFLSVTKKFQLPFDIPPQ